MAVTPISSYNSTTRITGLTSGMDTDTLVSNMMKSEQSKLDRYYKANTKLEWKKDSYTSIHTQLQDFRKKFMSSLSSDNVFSQNVFKAYKVNMADSKYMTIKATSSAAVASYKVTAARLAESATMEGARGRNRSVQVVSSTGNNKVYNTEGAATIDDPSKTLKELTVDGGTKAFANVNNSGDTLTFSINGTQFSFDGDDTLQDVMDTVNGTAGLNVTMSYDSGKISIAHNSAGASASLNLTNDDANNVFGTGGVFSNVAEGKVTGKNAVTGMNMTIGDLAAATGRTSALTNAGLRVSINGQEFYFHKDKTIQEMVDGINGNTNAKVNVAYDLASDTFSFKSTETGNAAKLTLKNSEYGGTAFGNNSFFGINEMSSSGYQEINRITDTIATAATKMGVTLSTGTGGMFSFAINGKTFSFNADTTLQSMMDTINGDSTVNVNMNYSQITDSFTFTSKDTGEATSITLTNVGTSNAFGNNSSFFGVAPGTEKGKDAMVTINGEDVYRSSNTFTIDGIQFNLNMNFNVGVDPADLKDDDIINFSISQDIDTVVDKVKTYVEEYNALVKSLTDLMQEERDYDYEPLSEAERSSLSEGDLEIWDTKAKLGLMRNDSTIAALLSSMRTAMFEKVGDTGMSPSDIGFSTGNYLEGKLTGITGGMIDFDEDKFRAAMAANPDAVSKVMAGITDTGDESVDRAGSGLITRVYNAMTATEKQINTVNLVNTDKSISKNEDMMKKLMEKMYEMEERYYLQFANMETLLTNYQQQSTWLSQQLSALLG